MGPCWPGTRSSLPCPSRCLKHRGLLYLQETWEAPWPLPSLALHRVQEPPSPFRNWPWLHKDPFLPSSNDHLLRPPSSSWAWPVLTACIQPEEGKRSHGCLEGLLNTHCALEVSKSPSAHGVYVSSSKSFDLAKVHATPNAHQSETLLVPSLQNPNRPPDFLAIWALPGTGTLFLPSLCSLGSSELWFEVTSKEKQSDVW